MDWNAEYRSDADPRRCTFCGCTAQAAEAECIDAAGKLTLDAVAAERARCLRHAEERAGLSAALEHDAVNKELDQQVGLTYSVGYGIAAMRIAARIRSGE